MQQMQRMHFDFNSAQSFYCLLNLPDPTQSVNLSARDICGSEPDQGSWQGLYGHSE